MPIEPSFEVCLDRLCSIQTELQEADKRGQKLTIEEGAIPTIKRSAKSLKAKDIPLSLDDAAKLVKITQIYLNSLQPATLSPELKDRVGKISENIFSITQKLFKKNLEVQKGQKPDKTKTTQSELLSILLENELQKSKNLITLARRESIPGLKESRFTNADEESSVLGVEAFVKWTSSKSDVNPEVLESMGNQIHFLIVSKLKFCSDLEDLVEVFQDIRQLLDIKIDKQLFYSSLNDIQKEILSSTTLHILLQKSLIISGKDAAAFIKKQMESKNPDFASDEPFTNELDLHRLELYPEVQITATLHIDGTHDDELIGSKSSSGGKEEEKEDLTPVRFLNPSDEVLNPSDRSKARLKVKYHFMPVAEGEIIPPKPIFK